MLFVTLPLVGEQGDKKGKFRINLKEIVAYHEFSSGTYSDIRFIKIFTTGSQVFRTTIDIKEFDKLIDSARSDWLEAAKMRVN